MNLIPHYHTYSGVITIGIDFHALERYYSIDTAVEMYMPMYRTVSRLLQRETAYLKVSVLDLLNGIKNKLIQLNSDRTYPIPIKYISFTRDIIDQDYVAYPGGDVPFIFDNDMMKLYPSLITLIYPIRRGELYISGHPTQTSIISIHLLSENVEFDIVHKLQYGVKKWDQVDDAIQFYLNSNIGCIILHGWMVIVEDTVVNHLTNYTYLLNKIQSTVYVDCDNWEGSDRYHSEVDPTGLIKYKIKYDSHVQVPIDIFDISSYTTNPSTQLIDTTLDDNIVYDIINADIL